MKKIDNYKSLNYESDEKAENNYTSMEKKEKANQDPYSQMLNAKGANSLAKIPTSPNAIKAQFVYRPELESGSLFTSDDVKITIRDFENKTQLGNSIIFFYFLLCSFTKNVSYKENPKKLEKKETREIFLDIEEYLKYKGKDISPNNKKNAIRDIKTYFDTLKNMSLDFQEYNYKEKSIKTYSLEIFSGKGTSESLIKRSRNYFFILNYDLVNYLVERNYITYFPNNAFSIDIMRYPSALSVTNYLAVLYSQNYLKTNKGIVSIKNLLANTPDIPSFETVAKENRNYFNRIIEPLEKVLDYLQNKKILSKWEWTNKNKEPLSDAQLDKYNNTLENCYLSYEMADYPEHEQELFKKRKDEKKAKQAARNKKKV